MSDAIVILGMHRSGTSCLAGMLAAGGLASAGDAVRNWDNARGHHEMLDVVRLDEAVLAHSGGHYLAAPRAVTWTEAHAATRDRLLRAHIAGRPALLKDPRMLLVLPFWRATHEPFHAIGIVRHPLAVARSLESWRGMPLHEGIALWTAHNRALAADRKLHGYPLIDFDQPRDAVIAAVLDAARAISPRVDTAALAAAYEDQLVHHDDGDVPDVPGLAEAIALHAELASGTATRRGFPRAHLAAFERALQDGAIDRALDSARAALSAVADAAAVLVPVITALVRRRHHAVTLALIEEEAPRLEPGVADAMLGKVLLARGDASAALRHLEAACAVPHPMFQARSMKAQALRGAGRLDEARAAMTEVAREALYPHGPLATLAEWSWLDGEHARAIAEMAAAIEAAPPHRRGRLRTRRAEWLIARGDPAAARDELTRAIDEDPGYARSRDVLATIR